MTKVLVANRGEIAIRIITAAAELGFATVAVYSDNQDISHCFSAHEAIKLNNTASFLDPEQIIEAAKSVNATAIHPGYGFLSESVDLTNKCKEAGIIFIGPSAACISSVGDKVSARQVAEAAGVPVIPGTEQSVSTPEQVFAFANQFGYPIMLKARDGGGGRGIRMVQHAKEVPESLKRCINESPSKQVFIEKAIISAKHIEVQIIGDNYGNVVHLFERDCSIQRRYQKILEVAPCPCLPPQLRDSIHQAAVRLARHIQYNSAGTVEFLVCPDANKFYFLEVNPRIQVEHTISEQITHIDIVQTQIRTALGESLTNLGLSQDMIQANNNRLVSIQARVVAENPLNNNMLSVGKIRASHFPQGHGIRVDTWIQPGCVVLPSFDSLLAKVIVTAPSYTDALSKLKLALQNTMIEGVETNIQFLIAVISDYSFVGDQLSHVHIKSLEDKMASLIDTTLQLGKTQRKRLENASTSAPAIAPPSTLQFKPGDAFNIEMSQAEDTKAIESVHSLQIDSISTNNFPDVFCAQIQTSLLSSNKPITITLTRKSAIGASSSSTLRRKANSRVPTDVGSPVTGMLVEINVKEGDVVALGQQLFVMSAMKMETVILASIAGTVKAVYAAPNDLIDAGDIVIELAKESKL